LHRPPAAVLIAHYRRIVTIGKIVGWLRIEALLDRRNFD
jgi:hypothetical protein